MSLRTWFRDLLGGPEANDPDAMTDLTTTRPFQVPILQQLLDEQGIATQQSDVFDAVTAETRVRVQVARRDLEAATKILHDLNAR